MHLTYEQRHGEPNPGSGDGAERAAARLAAKEEANRLVYATVVRPAPGRQVLRRRRLKLAKAQAAQFRKETVKNRRNAPSKGA